MASAPISSAAESIYAAARPRLLQIRTLVESADRQSSLGSGFSVSADGFALTNYHVVSQYALEPATYRLEYAAPDGSRGPLTLQAIDVVNDLAVVRLDEPMPSYFEFDPRGVAGSMPKGERLFAMGNPLDLGFTIVEGTYNGLVDYSYNERIHFTGALNPGMSGGPTVTAEGRIAGVNVAKQLSGELVSFLVPPREAAALVAKARDGAPLTPEDARAEITRQLTAWQAGLMQAVAGSGFRPATFGPYLAPESAVPWLNCWARTNADAKPKPRAILDTTQCKSRTSLFIAGNLQTGQIEFSHAHARSVDLNAFQFAAFVAQQIQPSWTIDAMSRRLTPQQCHEDFLEFRGGEPRPLMRAVWCSRAYREFDGLYDVSVMAVTQDRSSEALVSRLELRGTTYDNALLLGRQFLGAIGYAKAGAAAAESK
ncbi:MAG: trypsin-like peptidase domain-containing protein [Deltaproteobacteria bacterium]|nr:trypsin-like peptidase domain-containing protein [Deltaproteobacteria bacterium]